MCRCRRCNRQIQIRRLGDVTAQVGSAAAAAREVIGPLAQDAKDRLLPLALDAKDRLVPLALDAKERLTPIALDARARLVPLAEATVEHARPLVDSAADYATQARAKLVEVATTDIVPHLLDVRDQAWQRPVRIGAVTEEPVALTPDRRRHHPVLQILGLAALAATIWLIVKTLLGSRDDGWQIPDGEDEASEPVPVDGILETDFGEGSYRGVTPPDDFSIKGNERSMKFHVPGALGYERLVTDLWFNSPEAAERAGFTRALR